MSNLIPDMLANQNEFAQKLNRTIIPSSMSYEKKQTLYSELKTCADNIRSERLYRFRACSERSFAAFENDQFWVSRADCMNDGFDTRVFFDLKAVEAAVNKWKEYTVDKETLIKNGSELFANIPQFESARGMIEAMTDEQFENNIKQLIEYISYDALQTAWLIPSIVQQSLKFGCLSENINSAAMWGLYASDESGFALGYNFDSIPYVEPANNGRSRICSLYPVVYDSNRFRVSTDYVIYLLQYRIINMVLYNMGLFYKDPDFCKRLLNSGVIPDQFLTTKASLNKSDEWEREKEWRLFVSSADDAEFQNSKHGYCIKKPNAIYLGRRISRYNEIVLRHIAKDKGIQVYKMTLNDTDPMYELMVKEVPGIE